jgi:hypothetical protein
MSHCISLNGFFSLITIYPSQLLTTWLPHTHLKLHMVTSYASMMLGTWCPHTRVNIGMLLKYSQPQGILQCTGALIQGDCTSAATTAAASKVKLMRKVWVINQMEVDGNKHRQSSNIEVSSVMRLCLHMHIGACMLVFAFISACAHWCLHACVRVPLIYKYLPLCPSL